jgi:hypothetical protein
MQLRFAGNLNVSTDILRNVFAQGSDAIHLNTNENVNIPPGSDPDHNILNTDTFGEYYSQCDFDGDGVDDLFLATGATWWFASAGKFHWSFLNTSSKRKKDLRFGYFDGDDRCDVLTESGGSGRWQISSGGMEGWKPLAGTGEGGTNQDCSIEGPDFGVSLSKVVFGRFDPHDRDYRPNATRRTTHAFYRSDRGEWCVTPLSTPNWKHVGGSSFPMSELRFGDFTGDGITDVLTVYHGRWAISESARQEWREINPHLGEPIAELFIANMDQDDNIEDILRLERHSEISLGTETLELIWWRSKNGAERWEDFKRYSFTYLPGDLTVTYTPDPAQTGFASRFATTPPGGGTLVIDRKRIGNFHSLGPLDWTGLFPY